MEAIEDVGPWDETFEWYCADNDYYHRFRLRGWVVEECANLGSRVKHDVSGSIKENETLARRVSEQIGYRHAHLDHKWHGAKKVPYQG
jgi:GT2 family glycosyltransferase